MPVLTSPMESLPAELMSMVVQATGANNEPILSGEDVVNLRLTSRHYNYHTLNVWAKRFFTTRKHMLSRRSLQCLLDNANDPILSRYVREVAIGPGRINLKLISHLDPAHPDLINAWKRDYKSAWKKLVREHDALEASDAMESMLQEALIKFDNLQHIRVHSYPFSWKYKVSGEDCENGETDCYVEEEAGAWTQTWGKKSILRQIGMAESRGSDWPEPCHVFVKGDEYGSQTHGYYDRIFQTLRGVLEKDWTLGLDSFTLRVWYEPGPFDLTSPD
jgi:hypothetical protein